MSFDASQLLCAPNEVLTNGVLVHLSIRDLQAVNVAFTSTPTHRARIKELWKSYPYECPADVTVSLDDLKWLKSVEVKPVKIILGKMERSGMGFITSNFPTLQDLDATNVSDGLNRDLMMSLAEGCPLLENIRLVGICYESIRHLVRSCRHLQTINTCHSYHIYNSDIEFMCTHCPHLKHIGLYDCNNLTDASLRAIADSHPHLQSMLIGESWKMTDDGLIYLADKCHELRSVSVTCDIITSRGLTALWAANPNLMDVDISFNNTRSDNDIIQLVQCCPLLQKLNIFNCRQITDAAVIAVAEHCPQLRSLNIRSCYEVSDASLIALGQHCHELKSIDISYLKNISDVGIAALAAGCLLLQEFYASKTSITDAGVVAVARGCRDLRRLILSFGEFIGVAAISAIAENCPLVSELNLHNCKLVDDACLYVIAQHCHNLTRLMLSKTKVSADALRVVIASCRMLETIHCSECFNKQDLNSILECSRRAHVFVL